MYLHVIVKIFVKRVRVVRKLKGKMLADTKRKIYVKNINFKK